MSLEVALSFAMGATLVTLSFISLAATLYWAFFKKSIALLVSVIVLKWPILMFVMILVMDHFQVDLPAVAIGSMVWLPAGLLWHFTANSENES